jgi:hypothetical protein
LALLIASSAWLCVEFLRLKRINRERYLQIHNGMSKAEVFELLGPPTEPTALQLSPPAPCPVELATWEGWDCTILLAFSFDRQGEREQVVVSKGYGDEWRNFLQRIRKRIGRRSS